MCTFQLLIPKYFTTIRNVLRQGYVFTGVCESVHGGWCGRPPPPGRHPPRQTYPLADIPPQQTPPGRHNPPPWPDLPSPTRWLLQRTVRILLECILVLNLCLRIHWIFFFLMRKAFHSSFFRLPAAQCWHFCQLLLSFYFFCQIFYCHS